ncbi:MAG: FxLYD domain-containing protein, partial [Acidobacteriota bacterium]
LAGAAPAALADILVTQDGARIETKGPWKVEGRRVVFTMPNGTLSVLRASDVDLEASEEATRQALAPPAPPEAADAEETPKPEPVLVLTNKDIPQAAPENDGTPRPEVLPSIANREPVQVVAWKRVDTDSGIELRGTVRNTGRDLAANVTIRAEVKDEEGEILGTGNAFLGNASLVSGRSTTFRIVLPEVSDFAGDPVFSVTSTKLTVGGASVAREGQATPRSAGSPDAAGAADASSASGEDAEQTRLPSVEPEDDGSSGERP